METHTLRRIVAAASALLLPGASAQNSAENNPRILVMGDSLTAGRGVDPAEAFPAVLEDLLEENDLPFRVTAAGVSGETSAGGRRRIDWILQQPVDVFILALGGNDGLRGLSPEATAANLDAILKTVKETQPSAKLVVAGMRMPGNLGRDYTESFRAIFPTLAKEHDALLIPFLLEDVGGVPELNQSDRIHPNPAGHQKIARNLLRHLKPILEDRS